MQPVEFRLYYNDDGSVLFYTCDKPEGQHIVIDASVFADCKMNIKVIDGKIVKNPDIVFSQLVQAVHGTICAKEDVSILVTDDYIDTINWGTELHKVVGV